MNIPMTDKFAMSSQRDSRPWITIFPDHPRAFAWIRRPCDESELDSYVGPCCGDLFLQESRGGFRDEELPMWLAERFCSWMNRWEDFDMGDRMSDDENDITGEEQAIDDEGIELTRELKKLYGEKYRFRYSVAWRHGPKDWVVV